MEIRPDKGLQRNSYDLKMHRRKLYGSIFLGIVLILYILFCRPGIYEIELRQALNKWSVSSGWGESVKNNKNEEQ